MRNVKVNVLDSNPSIPAFCVNNSVVCLLSALAFISFCINIYKVINKKNKINGNNTKNQDIPLYPALHIRSKTQVKNNIYINSRINIAITLGVSQLKLPIQYLPISIKADAQEAKDLADEFGKIRDKKTSTEVCGIPYDPKVNLT